MRTDTELEKSSNINSMMSPMSGKMLRKKLKKDAESQGGTPEKAKRPEPTPGPISLLIVSPHPGEDCWWYALSKPEQVNSREGMEVRSVLKAAKMPGSARNLWSHTFDGAKRWYQMDQYGEVGMLSVLCMLAYIF